MPWHLHSGETGWVPQNSYFGPGGVSQIGDNVITLKFYDAKTGIYLGTSEYRVYTNSAPYQTVVINSIQKAEHL